VHLLRYTKQKQEQEDPNEKRTWRSHAVIMALTLLAALTCAEARANTSMCINPRHANHNKRDRVSQRPRSIVPARA
jgi:hypothetical protein